MSLNKAAKSSARTYRERHQPGDRGHLGLLEKRKDYRLRAKDYNEKKEILKHLRQKALNKNEDEFYHGMVNAQTLESGVHKTLVSAKKKDSSKEQIRLMQSQDHKYVSTRRLMERRKIEKLKSSLHLLDCSEQESRPRNRHTVFVDSEAEKKSLDLAERLDTVPQMLGRTTNRSRRGELLQSRIIQESIMGSSSKAYKQLAQRIQRHDHLAVVEEKMKLRRDLSNPKNKPHSIVREESDSNAPIIRWCTQRKR